MMHVGGPAAVAMESDSLSDSTTECASLGTVTEYAWVYWRKLKLSAKNESSSSYYSFKR